MSLETNDPKEISRREEVKKERIVVMNSGNIMAISKYLPSWNKKDYKKITQFIYDLTNPSREALMSENPEVSVQKAYIDQAKKICEIFDIEPEIWFPLKGMNPFVIPLKGEYCIIIAPMNEPSRINEEFGGPNHV